MTKVNRLTTNRVITIHSDQLDKLDRYTSELLDIIDSYGGSNPYPRFAIEDASDDFSTWYTYSCTTKINKEDAEQFDKEIYKWRYEPDELKN